MWGLTKLKDSLVLKDVKSEWTIKNRVENYLFLCYRRKLSPQGKITMHITNK